MITYTSWILPKLNDFYEVFAGENTFSTEMITDDNYLPIGGTGRFTGGPQQGLQGEITAIINGDWGHFKTDAPIDPPQFSTDVMVEKIKESMRRRNVPLLDVEVYQDGTISPETFQMFQTIRRLISSTNTQRNHPARGSHQPERPIRQAGKDHQQGEPTFAQPALLEAGVAGPGCRSKGHCRECSEELGIPIDCSCDHLQEKLDGMIALAFLRVLQEAMHNAMKHSGAKSITVRLTGSEQSIEGHFC